MPKKDIAPRYFSESAMIILRPSRCAFIYSVALESRSVSLLLYVFHPQFLFFFLKLIFLLFRFLFVRSTAPVAGRRTSLDLTSISAPFHITFTLTTSSSLFISNLNHVHHTRCYFRCSGCIPYRTGISQSSAHAFAGTFTYFSPELGILIRITEPPHSSLPGHAKWHSMSFLHMSGVLPIQTRTRSSCQRKVTKTESPLTIGSALPIQTRTRSSCQRRVTTA